MKILFTPWALLLLIAFILVDGVGCIPHQSYPWINEVEAYDLSPEVGKYSKVPIDQIIVYAGQKYAPKNYVLLAKLKSAENSDWLPQEVLMDEFKKKAAQLGADAVVVLDLTPEASEGGGAVIETGHQPSNDLGYIDHTHNTGITVVEPQPTKEVKNNKTTLFTGKALAIRANP